MNVNVTGIRKISTKSPNSILFNVPNQVSIGVIVADTGAVLDPITQRKVIKAGTPIGSSTNVFENRQTPVNTTNTAGTAAQTMGLLLHDVDVTNGNANGTMLIWGFVNLDRMDAVPVDEAKTALKGKISFFRD